MSDYFARLLGRAERTMGGLRPPRRESLVGGSSGGFVEVETEVVAPRSHGRPREEGASERPKASPTLAPPVRLAGGELVHTVVQVGVESAVERRASAPPHMVSAPPSPSSVETHLVQDRVVEQRERVERHTVERVTTERVTHESTIPLLAHTLRPTVWTPRPTPPATPVTVPVEPTIDVNIEEIRVIAVRPAPTAPRLRPTPPRSGLSLTDYLKRDRT